MASNNYKLDIKRVLESVDKKDRGWFSTLKPEEQDAFEPYVVMQFLSSGSNNTENEYFLEMTNEVLNKDFGVISKNKDLFYRLCCICGHGKKTFHPFIKPPKGSKNKISMLERFTTEFYDEKLKDDEIVLFVKKNKSLKDQDWKDYAESLDWGADDTKKLLTEVKSIKRMF